MDFLPEERLFSGLQSVLSSIFPFTDFRETCELQFVRYEIGNWTCRCGRLDGLHHLRLTCEHCGASFKAGDPHEDSVVCPDCGKGEQEPHRDVQRLRHPGGVASEVHGRGMPRTRYDLRSSGAPHLPSGDL